MHSYFSKSYGISRKQKTGIERSRYPNRAVTLIEQSPQQNYSKVCLTYLKFLAMPLESYGDLSIFGLQQVHSHLNPATLLAVLIGSVDDAPFHQFPDEYNYC